MEGDSIKLPFHLPRSSPAAWNPMEQETTDQSASPDQQASATLSTQASEPALSLSLNHSRPSGSTSGGDNNEAGSARDETQFSSKSTQFSTGRSVSTQAQPDASNVPLPDDSDESSEANVAKWLKTS